MATQCRETRKRTNRYKLIKLEAYALLGTLAIASGAAGFGIGRYTAPEKVRTETVTYTETVEAPVYEADKLPEIEDVQFYDVPLSHSLQRYIYEICADENVPVSLVMAMIQHESDFNPEEVSSTDDYGLMQINIVNHSVLEEQYKTADLTNPYQNVFCGIKMIGAYISQYGDYSKALMAYNMGEYGAKKAWANGIESTSYSKSILALMQEYEQEVTANE